MLRGWGAPKERFGMLCWERGTVWRSGIASWGLCLMAAGNAQIRDFLESPHQPLSALKLQIVFSKRT